VFAGGHYGRLELQDGFVAQTGSVGEVAGDTTDGGDQAFVGVDLERNLLR
jgi:hypothetical protein